MKSGIVDTPKYTSKNKKMSQVQESEYEQVPPVKDHIEMQENLSYGELKPSQTTAVTKASKKSTACNGSKNILTALVVPIVLVAVLTLVVVAACIAFALEISNVKTQIALTQKDHFSTADLESKLEGIINDSLEHSQSTNHMLIIQLSQKIESRLQQLNSSFNSQVTDLVNLTQQIINSLEASGESSIFPVSSCDALPPSSPSGYYWVRDSNGSAVQVYCDMTLECGNITGGWMRVAELDMTNSSHQCPSGFTERTDSNMHSGTNIRACVSSSSSPGCSSDIELNTFNISYTRVCGRVIGYQIGHTNAFAVQSNNISSYYVDGVSLTHGDPRQHIWTFAAARDETTSGSLDSKCPCILQNSEASVINRPPEFVGNDYFCDTGSNSDIITDGDFIGEDPLWDGAGCGATSTCCSFNSPPWFYKQLSQPTTDIIETRVCRNELARYEDIAIEIFDIYIQ